MSFHRSSNVSGASQANHDEACLVVVARADIAHDLKHHPAAGNFFSTLPIPAMIPAMDCLRLGPLAFGSGMAHAAVDFALGWWSLSFPIGALAVATGALNKLYRLPFFAWVEAGLTLVLLAVWVFVAIGTVRIVADGSAFERHE